jgi:hypothetical protein
MSCSGCKARGESLSRALGEIRAGDLRRAAIEAMKGVSPNAAERLAAISMAKRLTARLLSGARP